MRLRRLRVVAPTVAPQLIEVAQVAPVARVFSAPCARACVKNIESFR